VAAERLRIARELHDVVAHSMSVIAVQAGVAGHVIDTRPELAKDALSTVETLTRSALAEMRRLLGVLRTADEPSAALAPSPGLADLPELVSGLAIAGLPVDLQLDGDRGQVPAGADLSGYRIVQEALTNVLRHGGPAARVLVHCTPGAVEIDVQDAGRPAVNGAARPTSQAGNGHGLIGMRERVAVFGGQLSAGPSRGGGYRVHAVLPFDEPAATR
jgi:signal transduction histidine kinase